MLSIFLIAKENIEKSTGYIQCYCFTFVLIDNLTPPSAYLLLYKVYLSFPVFTQFTIDFENEIHLRDWCLPSGNRLYHKRIISLWKSTWWAVTVSAINDIMRKNELYPLMLDWKVFYLAYIPQEIFLMILAIFQGQKGIILNLFSL